MKWKEIKDDGKIYHHLKITKNIHIDIVPYGDRYIVWIGQNKWYYDTLRFRNFDDALQIAEDIAAVFKKHANKICSRGKFNISQKQNH